MRDPSRLVVSCTVGGGFEKRRGTLSSTEEADKEAWTGGKDSETDVTILAQVLKRQAAVYGYA